MKRRNSSQSRALLAVHDHEIGHAAPLAGLVRGEGKAEAQDDPTGAAVVGQ